MVEFLGENRFLANKRNFLDYVSNVYHQSHLLLKLPSTAPPVDRQVFEMVCSFVGISGSNSRKIKKNKQKMFEKEEKNKTTPCPKKAKTLQKFRIKIGSLTYHSL